MSGRRAFRAQKWSMAGAWAFIALGIGLPFFTPPAIFEYGMPAALIAAVACYVFHVKVYRI